MTDNHAANKTGAPRVGPPLYPVVKDEADGTDIGTLQIDTGVIAVIARMAAVNVKGVVDMSGSLVEGLAGMVGKKHSERGVHVELVDNCVSLDMSIVVEYGINIPKLAWEIQHQVRDAVERMTGKAVKSVNVTVKGVQMGGGRRAKGAESTDTEG